MAYGVPQGQGSGPSHSCNLHLWQGQILNPLCRARDWTCVLGLQRCCPSHCTTGGTPTLLYIYIFFFFFFLGLHLQHMEVPRLGVELEPQPHQLRIWAVSATYTTAHGNTRSLTYRARPGIKPETSWLVVWWLVVWFISTSPQWELLGFFNFSNSSGYVMVTPCGFHMHFPNDYLFAADYLFCAYHLSVCLLWWNVCSVFCLFFVFFFFYWAACFLIEPWVIYIFFIQILYR